MQNQVRYLPICYILDINRMVFNLWPFKLKIRHFLLFVRQLKLTTNGHFFRFCFVCIIIVSFADFIGFFLDVGMVTDVTM